jgi:hypothetical protein
VEINNGLGKNKSGIYSDERKHEGRNDIQMGEKTCVHSFFDPILAIFVCTVPYRLNLETNT